MRQEDNARPALPKVVEGGKRRADARVVRHVTVLHGHVEVDADQGGLAAPVHVADCAEAHSLLLTVALVEAAEPRRSRGFLPHMPGSPTISFKMDPLADVRPLMCRATKAVMSDRRQA